MTIDKHQDRLPGEDEVTGILAQDKHTQPRAELDATILAAAKQTVTNKSADGTSRASKWAIPISLAATIILSVSVVMLVQTPPVPESKPKPLTEQISPRVAMTPAPATSDVPAKPSAPAARHKARQAEADPLRRPSRVGQETQQSDSLSSAAVSEEKAEPAFRESVAGIANLEKSAEPRLTAEAWLEKINALLEKNQRDKARDELVQLHQAYPDFRSDTMQTLAKQLEVELNDSE